MRVEFEVEVKLSLGQRFEGQYCVGWFWTYRLCLTNIHSVDFVIFCLEAVYPARLTEKLAQRFQSCVPNLVYLLALEPGNRFTFIYLLVFSLSSRQRAMVIPQHRDETSNALTQSYRFLPQSPTTLLHISSCNIIVTKSIQERQFHSNRLDNTSCGCQVSLPNHNCFLSSVSLKAFACNEQARPVSSTSNTMCPSGTLA